MEHLPVDPQAKRRIMEGLRQAMDGIDDIIAGYVHGSFIQEGRPARDLDVAVLMGGDFSASTAIRRELALEEELGTALGVPVDVRVLNHAPVAFRFQVLARGRLLVEKDESRRVDYECMVHADYRDFKHHLDNYRREALGLET